MNGSSLRAAGYCAQADLRTDWGVVRFAMNSARRAPRAHGITVSSLAAVSTMDLMKRVLIFIIVTLCYFGVCSFVEDQYADPFGRR